MNTQILQPLTEINKLIFVKQYEDAWQDIATLAKKSVGPDDLLIHLRRIELAAKLKKLGELYQEYSDEWTKQPDNLTLEQSLIFVEIHGEMCTADESLAKLQTILKKHPEMASVYYGIGFSLELQGNIDRAIFNYQRSIEIDEQWYPSYFGLSQLNYQKGDIKLGDQYFLMFEKLAPYNVYGNFETHRDLCNEFIEREQYREANVAISSLVEWWVENKSQCPPEISIYCDLQNARIFELQGDSIRQERSQEAAYAQCEQLLTSPDTSENVSYFVAKVLEDFGDFEMALKFYKKTIRSASNTPGLIQKIGGKFLSMGEFQLSFDIFTEGYHASPDNPEIHFCMLVSRLKLAGQNVEEYLIGKERLKQLVQSNADKVEVLASLHSLLAKFQEDSDIHAQIGEVYLRLGNIEKAGRHFAKMYELDPLSQQSGLRYVSFLIHHGDIDQAWEILEPLSVKSVPNKAEQTEINWLQASYFSRKKDFLQSQIYLRRALNADPWNVSYVMQHIVNATQLSSLEPALKQAEPILQKLMRLDEADLDWEPFDAITEEISQDRSLAELVYAREKLRFLYSDGSEEYIKRLVQSTCLFDAQQGTYDFLRLINTNFDSPFVTWGLGKLHKELWQLEVASMWFEQTLLHPAIEDDLRASCLTEVADCSIWLGRNLTKAVEYAKLARELPTSRASLESRNVLIHAYIKSGQLKLAESHVEEAAATGHPLNDFDYTYLRGLVEYRNGSQKQANQIWKPLLSVNSQTIRAHVIKQEILKYYFDSAPYLKDLKVH